MMTFTTCYAEVQIGETSIYAGTNVAIGTVSATRRLEVYGDMVLSNSGKYYGDGSALTSIAESDPQVGTLTNTKWCTTDGTDIDCITDAPTGTGDITDVFNCVSGDCSSITVTDGDLLNFSGANNSVATEGIILPQSTAPTGGTAEGQIGWDTDNNFALIGDSSSVKRFVDVTQLYPSDATSTKCTANLTSDAPTALAVAGCSYYSFTSNDATSTNRTFCLLAGTEGQIITLFADVSGTNEIELGDGAAGACAGATGAATFLAGVWPAATTQNNDVAQIVYRTTASGAAANGWYEINRAAN